MGELEVYTDEDMLDTVEIPDDVFDMELSSDEWLAAMFKALGFPKPKEKKTYLKGKENE